MLMWNKFLLNFRRFLWKYANEHILAIFLWHGKGNQGYLSFRKKAVFTLVLHTQKNHNKKANATRNEVALNFFGRILQFSSVQLLSHFRLFATPWIAACQASLPITNSRSSPRLIHQVGDAIQPSHPLSSPSPPAPNPSQYKGLFKWVSSLHQVAKVLEFQL